MSVGRLAEERDRAQDERDESQEALEETQETLEETQETLEETQETLEEGQEREQQAVADGARYLRWSAVALVGGATVALLLWVTSRRSVSKAQREQVRAETLAQAAQSEVEVREARDRLASAVPAVFLDGADGDGRPLALRIPGSAIAAAGGAVVGRNPFDSTVVLDHTEVSRRHFRLFARGASILIEDLNSTNGTAVNETALSPGASVPLPGGAVLHVGSLTLTVTLQG